MAPVNRLALVRSVLGAGALVSGAGLAYATAPSPPASAEARHATRRGPPLISAAPETQTRVAVAEPLPDVVAPTPAELGTTELAEADLAAPPGEAFAGPFRDGKIITGATPHRLILFTFDDGPDKRTTPRLLDELDRVGVKAVFFLSAHRIRGTNRTEREQAEIAREIVRRGHLVGNHTTFHVALPTLNSDEVRAELATSESIFEQVFGERPWLFRPPYGVHTARTDGLLSERGYTQILWNLGTGDFQVRDADSVVRTWKAVLARREAELGERGGVVLLHDTHAWSVEAFPRLVEELRRRNCDLLATGEELYDIVDDPALFYAPRGDADPAEVAEPVRLSPEVLTARQARVRERERARCEGEVAIVDLP